MVETIIRTRSSFRQTMLRVSIFLMIGLVSSLFNCLPCFAADSSQNPIIVILYYTIMFVTIYYVLRMMIDYIDVRLSWLTDVRLKFVANVSLILLVVVPLSFLFSYIPFSTFWVIPFDQNPFFFFYQMTVFHSITGVIISIYVNADNFLSNWRTENEKNALLMKQKTEFELKSLKNQLNPHFLFNNLHTLSSLIHEDQDSAEKFIEKLSEVFRYILSQDKNLLPIEDELKFLRSYTYLLKIRFGENLLIDIQESNWAGQYVPPLTLQLLTENAIKHNIISKSKPLKVKVSQSDQYIHVTNNVQPKRTVAYSSGIGLKNIKDRYELISRKKVLINEDAQSFSVRLPILHEENLYESIDY